VLSWRLLIASLTLLVPIGAMAASTSVWEFNAQSTTMGTWDVKGWEAPQLQSDGVHIRASKDGRMIRDTALTHPVDTIRLVFTRVKPTEGLLIWHIRGTPEDSFVQLPLQITNAADPAVIEVDLTPYPAWDRRADKIGLVLPAGADLVLQRIELTGHTPAEKLSALWKSFWNFDTMRAYSINFLWGPILRTTDIGVDSTFDTLPPVGRSGNWIFYGALLLAVAVLLVRHFLKRPAARPLWVLLLVAAGCWIAYDIRMGAEIVSYAVHDYRSYVSQPLEKQTFRSYDNFFSVVEQSLPALRERPVFAFVGPEQGPFISRVRYLAYPSRPVRQEESLQGVNTWLVFYRDDFTVDAQGRLLQDGNVLINSGEILKRFSDNSFLYRVHE